MSPDNRFEIGPFFLDHSRRRDPMAGNSIHGDDGAQTAGFTGALIPGTHIWEATFDHLLADHDGRLPATAQMTNVRPMYEGGRARVEVVPREGGVDLTVRDDETVFARGSLEFPAAGEPMDAPGDADYGDIDYGAPAVPARPGVLVAGTQLISEPIVLDAGESIIRDQEQWSRFAARESVPVSAVALNVATESSFRSLAFESVNFHYGAEVTYLAPVAIGDSLTSVGQIVDVFHRGRFHYYSTDEQILRDGVPVALVRRSAVYAMDGVDFDG